MYLIYCLYDFFYYLKDGCYELLHKKCFYITIMSWYGLKYIF